MRRKSSDSVRIYYPRLSREELISLLKERVRILSEELSLDLVVLFGSYATGRFTVASDVDLFAVIRGGRKDYAYVRMYDILGVDNLQLHIYTREEYEKLKKNSPFFMREVEGKGVVIFKA